MSKYVVIPIQISLKNKKFANSGDIVDESQLNSPTHELLSGNFIRLATDEEIDSVKKEDSSDEDFNDEDNNVFELKSDELNPDVNDYSDKGSDKSSDVSGDKSKDTSVELSKKDAVKNALKTKE